MKLGLGMWRHLVIYYVCGRNSSCLGIFYTAIVFVANIVRVPSLRNVLPFSDVFLLSKAIVVLSLFLRLEDDDSAVALPTSPFWDSGTWQRQRSAAVNDRGLRTGVRMFSRANISKMGSVPVLKTQFSGKPRRNLPQDVLFDFGNLPVV